MTSQDKQELAQRMIKEECDKLAEFLIEKNKSYGNSAIEPINIFSKADVIEQINVRIDDKLNRLLQGREYPGDDDIKDIVGYYILKEVAKRWKEKNSVFEGQKLVSSSGKIRMRFYD